MCFLTYGVGTIFCKYKSSLHCFYRRVGVARSEAEVEQIMEGLTEQEEEDKKMRNYSVIPPMLLDNRQRKQRFLNTNGLIENAMEEYQERKHINVWTELEKDIFLDKYLQHPKNFVFIASFLERKVSEKKIKEWFFYLISTNLFKKIQIGWAKIR